MDGFMAFYITIAIVFLGLFLATKYNEKHGK